MLGSWTRPKLIAFPVLVATAALVAGLIFSPATAQPPNPPGAPVVGNEGGPAGQRPEAGARGRLQERMQQWMAQNPAMMQRMDWMRQASAPPAIAVAGDAVFVVKGNWLYKFNTADLSLAAKAPLEEEPPMPMAGGGGFLQAPQR